MLFDESYNQHFYRVESVQNFAKKADLLLVIGTTLETALAKQIVLDCLKREIPVVEVCYPGSVINAGNNL